MTTQKVEQLKQLFEGIRRAQSDGRFSPHKPLLLLLALARAQQGAQRLTRLEDIDPQLQQLLREFGPTNAAKSRHYPFWHLQTDGKGQLWEVVGPASLLQRNPGATPNLSELKQDSVFAGFSESVDKSLKQEPALIPELGHLLLQSYFPETLHADIAEAVGLDLTVTNHRVEDASESYESVIRKKRTRAFRDMVLRAYEYRCCVCGFDLRIGHIPAGLEAAHIQWHTAGGPDIGPNGLSLCALHHKLFDLGAFTLTPDSQKIVFSEHAVSGTRGLTGELQHHGKSALEPTSAEAKPGAHFLEWNWSHVFKREARTLVRI